MQVIVSSDANSIYSTNLFVKHGFSQINSGYIQYYVLLGYTQYFVCIDLDSYGSNEATDSRFPDPLWLDADSGPGRASNGNAVVESVLV